MHACDCMVMITEAESFGWWLDWPTEDVGYETESLHTEQQTACKWLLHYQWISYFTAVETWQQGATEKLMLSFLWSAVIEYRDDRQPLRYALWK